MKMAVFWVVAPCSLERVYNVSEICTACIIRVMSDIPVYTAYDPEYSHLQLKMKHKTEEKTVCAFSENRSNIHDAIKSIHWNNAHATVRPFLAYNPQNGALQHNSFVVTSHCLKHGTAAAHLFATKLRSSSWKVKTLAHICSFSHGATAQNKNRKKFHRLLLLS
jgi:hypothetical protein